MLHLKNDYMINRVDLHCHTKSEKLKFRVGLVKIGCGLLGHGNLRSVISPE